jgi:hypothetical protein
VPSEVLARFAPTPIPSDVSRREIGHTLAFFETHLK